MRYAGAADQANPIDKMLVAVPVAARWAVALVTVVRLDCVHDPLPVPKGCVAGVDFTHPVRSRVAVVFRGVFLLQLLRSEQVV